MLGRRTLRRPYRAASLRAAPRRRARGCAAATARWPRKMIRPAALRIGMVTTSAPSPSEADDQLLGSNRWRTACRRGGRGQVVRIGRLIVLRVVLRVGSESASSSEKTSSSSRRSTAAVRLHRNLRRRLRSVVVVPAPELAPRAPPRRSRARRSPSQPPSRVAAPAAAAAAASPVPRHRSARRPGLPRSASASLLAFPARGHLLVQVHDLLTNSRANSRSASSKCLGHLDQELASRWARQARRTRAAGPPP